MRFPFTGICFLLLLSSASYGQPVDCAKPASRIDRTVCADETLRTLDTEANRLYLQALQQAASPGEEARDRYAWLQARNRCEKASSEQDRVSCLVVSYGQRVDALKARVAASSLRVDAPDEPRAAQTPGADADADETRAAHGLPASSDRSETASSAGRQAPAEAAPIQVPSESATLSGAESTTGETRPAPASPTEQTQQEKEDASVDDIALAGFVLLLGAIAFAAYILPTIVAFTRGHAYKWIILILNVCGFFGVTWVVAMIWALFPSEKSLIDPVVGNVTGTGERNVGDTLGSVHYGRERGYSTERARH